MKRLLRKTVYEYDYVEDIDSGDETSDDSDYEEEVSESDFDSAPSGSCSQSEVSCS